MQKLSYLIHVPTNRKKQEFDIYNRSVYISIFQPQTCIKLLMGITNDSPMFELQFWENNDMEIKRRYEILWINGSEISRSFLFISYTSFVFLREQSISIPSLCTLISIKPRWSSVTRQHSELFYIFYYRLTTSQWRILLEEDVEFIILYVSILFFTYLYLLTSK
jgi:hypothetical protein